MIRVLAVAGALARRRPAAPRGRRGDLERAQPHLRPRRRRDRRVIGAMMLASAIVAGADGPRLRPLRHAPHDSGARSGRCWPAALVFATRRRQRRSRARPLPDRHSALAARSPRSCCWRCAGRRASAYATVAATVIATASLLGGLLGTAPLALCPAAARLDARPSARSRCSRCSPPRSPSP